MSKVKIRIEFISEGFREILCSEGVRAEVESVGAGIQARANASLEEESEGYYLRTANTGGGGRWAAFVGASDHAALVAESENQVLTKAVG